MEVKNENTTPKTIPNDVDKEQKGINVPNLRFEGFTDKWEKKFLSAYMNVSPARNKNNLYTRTDVLSVSGDLGCVNQIELLGRSFAGESLIPYHIVELNDIVYTKSPLSENPYGIIKTNRYKTGIVSTLYAVYKAKETADNRFIEHYFSLKSRVNNYLKPIVRIGAKHDMKIGNEEVLNNYVIFPNKKEQQKISDFIDLLDYRIKTQSKIIEQIKSQIKSICHIMCNINNNTVKLKEVCFFENKTNHQSGEGLSSGKYIYFTNEEETTKYFNSYDYDGEYIIANTGGKANFKYYNGKFATMSDCLVIKCFENVKTKFILYSLLNCIEKINHVGFVGSGLKHLDKDWFENMNLPQYSSIHDKYLNLINNIALKLEKEELLLKKLKEQKKYLLSNMFI